jgi:hypothetical protein
MLPLCESPLAALLEAVSVRVKEVHLLLNVVELIRPCLGF